MSNVGWEEGNYGLRSWERPDTASFKQIHGRQPQEVESSFRILGAVVKTKEMAKRVREDNVFSQLIRRRRIERRR